MTAGSGTPVRHERPAHSRRLGTRSRKGVLVIHIVAAGAVRPDTDLVTNLLIPPIASRIGLLIAVLLAVFKPWGRIRKVAA